jgi:vancomycin resistance protein YoaR
MRKPKALKKLKYLLYVVYAGLLIVTGYHLYYGHRIVPGVFVGKVAVGGLTYDKAKQKLVAYDASIKKDVSLSYNGQTFTVSPSDVALEYDWDSSVVRAFEIGRTGNFIIDSKDKLAALVKGIKLRAFYDYDDNAFSNKLAVIKGELDQDAKEAQLVDNSGKVGVSESALGYHVDDVALYEAVVTSYDYLDFSQKAISVREEDPKITTTDAQSLVSSAEKIVSNPITISYKEQKWVVDRTELLALLTIEKDTNKPQLALNTASFEGYTNSIAQSVNELPRGQVTAVDGTKVVSFAITQAGRQLDFDKLKSDFKNALFNAASTSATVQVSMRDVTAPATKENYGIYSLLGTGESKYAGSITGRIHNIALAASRTNGVLVPPGGIYSMYAAVGDVSAATGYDQAYIIQNGRTVLGDGGGVCQVSTTLFRAVLNAGLPIVMRYPHAYRVHYYEQDSPVGIDASIYFPSVDFQFKNDTPNYILVQSVNDPTNVKLVFNIYGTPDGRTVDMSKPVILNQTPPPAPLYQNDPTLPKGTTQQVDWEAWGATVKFTREVKRGDTVLDNDTFTSDYQPWRAVYLVGTK